MTVEELRLLIAAHTPPCVSIYLPTRRGGGIDDRKRFDAQVLRARELLRVNLPEKRVEDLIAPLQTFASEFNWKETLEGLAVFRADDFSAEYRLPSSVPELAVASDSFHIRPLVSFLQTNQSYYLLSLNQNNVAFFRGSAGGLAPIDLRHLPRSLTEVLGIEHHDQHVSKRSNGSMGHGAIYGGASKSDTSRDEDLLRFFRAIDKALWELLRDDSAPLVIAATERPMSMYRSISRYPHLASRGLVGNYSRSSSEELHAQAWPIVQQDLGVREIEVLERYNNLVSRSRALDEVRAIAQFAVQGRVRELLLAEDARLWGTLDRNSGELHLHGEQHDARDDDVLDDLSEAVLARGGDVYSLSPQRMPSMSSVAAILRW
jgi:hypothetical protein